MDRYTVKLSKLLTQFAVHLVWSPKTLPPPACVLKLDTTLVLTVYTFLSEHSVDLCKFSYMYVFFFQIVIPCPCDPSAPYKESRPQALQLQASQVFITNSRTGYKCTQTDMLMFLQQFLGSKVYNDYHNFPACNSDARPLPNSAWVNDNSLLASDGKIDRLLNGVCSDVFDTHQPSQVQCRTIFASIIVYILLH